MSPYGKKTNRPRRHRLEVAAVVALAVTLGLILSEVFMAASGSADRVYTAGEDVLARDVIVVLDAKTDPGRPLRLPMVHLSIAVDLFRSSRDKMILIAGANTTESNCGTQVIEDYLISRSIPVDRIVQGIVGYDTYDSYIRARDMFGVWGMTVISQAYHLPRMMTTCHALGVDAIGVGDVTAQRNQPERYLQEKLRELPAYVEMQLDLLRRAKTAQSPPSNAIQGTLRRS